MGLPRFNPKGLAVSAFVLVAVLAGVWVTGHNSPLQSHIRAGARAEASGDYETALKEYNLALEASPGNWDVQARIAQVRLDRKEFKQVDEMLTALVNKDESRGKALYGLLTQALLGEARQAIDKGPQSSSTQAMTFLERALRYSPDDREVKQLMAKELYAGAMRMPPNQSIALDMLKRAISLDPNPMYRLELAYRYLTLGRKTTYALSQFRVGQILWAPDSSRLLLSQPFQGEPADGQTRLINSSGEELTSFKTKAAITYIGWNAEGKLLAVVYDQSYFYRRPQLHLVSVNEQTGALSPAPGSEMTQASGAYPGLSPGGKFITFTGPATGSGRWGELWVMPVDKSAPHLVSTNGAFLGWSGPDKMVFADVTDLVDHAQTGMIRKSRIGKVTEITIGD